MSQLIEHIEYLVGRHDCVVIPGIGAIMARYRNARYDSRNSLVLLPPSRQIVFNGMLNESDGLLEHSVARRNGVTYEAARRMVAEECSSLRAHLEHFGSLSLGCVGELEMGQEDTVLFNPRDVSKWDLRYAGLRPLYLKTAESTVGEEYVGEDPIGEDPTGSATPTRTIDYKPAALFESYDDDQEYTPGRRPAIWRRVAGIAASLAVLITLSLFLLNPILIKNQPVKASLAPEIELTGQQEAIPDDAELNNVQESVDIDAMEEAETVTTAARADAPSGGATTKMRFNTTDAYCVVVASFPGAAQAERYLAENPGRQLGVVNQDGKYRVYGATGETYNEATRQKVFLGQEDAWVCHR